MDGHFSDKPSYLISGDGCHLPPKTLFPSFKQNLIFEYTQCDETHCQFHFSLYCLASSSTRIKWEIQMVSTILVRRLFYLYLSHTNRPFNRHQLDEYGYKIKAIHSFSTFIIEMCEVTVTLFRFGRFSIIFRKITTERAFFHTIGNNCSCENLLRVNNNRVRALNKMTLNSRSSTHHITRQNELHFENAKCLPNI